MAKKSEEVELKKVPPRKIAKGLRDEADVSGSWEEYKSYFSLVASFYGSLETTRLGLNHALKMAQLPKEKKGKNITDPLLLAPLYEALQDAKAAQNKVKYVLSALGEFHFMGDWIEDIKGIDHYGFGKLIGITDVLDDFESHTKLWRFLGQSVEKDGLSPHCTKGVKSFYSRRGRAHCKMLGEKGFIMHPGSKYSELYYKKKAEYESRPRTGPSNCPFNQVHKNKQGKIVSCEKAHIHNAARRYAVKAFIKDLWFEWRRRVREMNQTEEVA